jgi:hypothetical protein
MTVRDHALLPPEKLRKTTDPAVLGFTTTSNIDCLEGLIGQKRAVKPFSFGPAFPPTG